MKTKRDFHKRDIREQRWLIDNTWCDVCNEADLGVNNPVEYEENGEIIIEGICRKCNSPVFTHASEKNTN